MTFDRCIITPLSRPAIARAVITPLQTLPHSAVITRLTGPFTPIVRAKITAL